MNEPTIRLETRPEVTAFVERVRARLGDLSDEDREELVGGLEADIAELVADGGTVAELGDPRAYADELRTAAGLAGARPEAPAPARGVRRPLGERLEGALDDARRGITRLSDSPRYRGVAAFLASLRPVWWVLRAWVAMQLLALFVWRGEASAVPMVGGLLLGSALWLAAVVVSVQIGRGAIWPGSGPDRPVTARLVLLGLNAFAILTLPLAVEQLPSAGMWEQTGYAEGYLEPAEGLVLDGNPVANVFPYDAQGRPLTGVQLFTDSGAPLRVSPWAAEEYDESGDRVLVTYPWLNGEQELYNVFPLPRRSQDVWEEGLERLPDAWTSADPPVLPGPPLAVVPPATLPGQEPAPDSDAAAGPKSASGSAPGSAPGSGAARDSDSEKPEGR